MHHGSKAEKKNKKVMMMLNFESEDEMPKLATLQTQLQLLHTFNFGSFTARFKNHVSIVSRVSYIWLKNLKGDDICSGQKSLNA